MNSSIQSIGIERLLIVFLLSACWVFVYIGINSQLIFWVGNQILPFDLQNLDLLVKCG